MFYLGDRRGSLWPPSCQQRRLRPGPPVAFAGALLAATVIYLFTWRGGIAGGRLVLVGIGINAILSAGATFLMVRYPIEGVNSAQPAGTLVQLRAAGGGTLLAFTPERAFESLVFSSPDLVAGATYEVFIGGSATGPTTDGLAAGGSGGTRVATLTAS